MLVLEHGRVVEDGSPQELMAAGDGHYAGTAPGLDRLPRLSARTANETDSARVRQRRQGGKHLIDRAESGGRLGSFDHHDRHAQLGRGRQLCGRV